MDNDVTFVTDVTGILLAGGKSRRMGRDKRHLSVGDRTLLERSLSALSTVFHEVFVVIAQDSPALGITAAVLRDLVPDCGSLGGLYTGLKQSSTPYVFVVACDMPFLDPRVIRRFLYTKDEWDVVMAKQQRQLHPMHALYSRQCLPVIEEMIWTRDFKIQSMVAHPSLRVRIVEEADLRAIDPAGHGLMNVNTPADLESARELVKRGIDPSVS
ncbi:MAG TPA: molybdenum cofactor guanylyltransferase [Nitrospira sp.]|nr:molybdenum cofactor guanylyltransferase [Nitrospira sp.]